MCFCGFNNGNPRQKEIDELYRQLELLTLDGFRRRKLTTEEQEIADYIQKKIDKLKNTAYLD